MQQNNVDQNLLDAQRVDPNDPQPVLSQALRIAAYDEFEAYNTYSNVITKFGNVLPFSNIINSEINHYNEMITLMQKYGVEAPIVEQTQVELPNTLHECCEIAVAAEIDNVALYDNLLMYVNEPDVRDLFYRVQAASFNNHLPAFRACVASFYNQANPQVNNQVPQMQQNGANMMDNMAQYQELLDDAMNGNIDQNKIMSMLSNMNMSMMSGLAVGALGGMALSSMINKEDITEE